MDHRSDVLAAGVASSAPEQVNALRRRAQPRRAPGALLRHREDRSRPGPAERLSEGRFLRHQLRQSRSSVLVTDAAGRDAVAPLRLELPHLHTVVMLDDARATKCPMAHCSTATRGHPTSS